MWHDMGACCRCAAGSKLPAGKGCQTSYVPALSPQYLQLRIGRQVLWHLMGSSSDFSPENDRILRHMFTHPLKAWSLDEWGMPTASTGAVTSFDADYCWWLRARCSSTIGLPEGSFLAGLIAAYSYPSRKIDLTRGLVLCEEARTLDGTPQESDVWTQATWLKSPFWFKQSLANFSSELDAVVFLLIVLVW